MNKTAQKLIFLLVALLAAYYFTQLHFMLVGELDCAHAADLMQGKGNTPYQYRVLVPWIARFIVRAELHLPFGASVNDLFFAIEAGFVFLALLAFRQYLSLFIDRRASCLLAFTLYYALFFNLTLPVFAALRYPSDVPSVFFMTMGLALIYRGAWRWYYPLFILATLNRETTCFLTVTFLFTSWGKRPARNIAFHCAVQLAIWLGIKAWLHHLYAGNPGSGLFEHHFRHNLPFFLNPRHYPYFLSTIGFAWIPALFCFRRIKEPFVRRALLTVIPFMAGMLYVGNIYEIRLHAELIPLILPATLLIIRDHDG